MRFIPGVLVQRLRAIALAVPMAFALPAAALAQPAYWLTATPPQHIVGPIWFVGTQGLAAYLIVTPQGLILIDGALPQSAPVIEAAIRKAGFRPRDIKQLLITHAHADHVGTLAFFKRLSGAPFAVMEGDFASVKSGGRADPITGKRASSYFPPVNAERVLREGDTVSLGGITLTARLGAGHTRGATTWTTTVADGGRDYRVVFPCCTTVNPGYRLVNKPSYPGITDDYRRTFAMLAALQPDIWLAAHTDFFDFAGKRNRAAREGVQAWVDPDGYRHFIANAKALFDGLLLNGP